MTYASLNKHYFDLLPKQTSAIHINIDLWQIDQYQLYHCDNDCA